MPQVAEEAIDPRDGRRRSRELFREGLFACTDVVYPRALLLLHLEIRVSEHSCSKLNLIMVQGTVDQGAVCSCSIVAITEAEAQRRHLESNADLVASLHGACQASPCDSLRMASC